MNFLNSIILFGLGAAVLPLVIHLLSKRNTKETVFPSIRLLELLSQGVRPPAVILGFPVGFIGAAESKAALIAHAGAIPFVALSGLGGGSAIAAAAVDALVGDGEDDGRGEVR